MSEYRDEDDHDQPVSEKLKKQFKKLKVNRVFRLQD